MDGLDATDFNMLDHKLECIGSGVGDIADALNEVERPTLRDQFAMAALNGMLTHSDTGHWDYFATQAYRFADAMLTARGK